MEYKKAKNSFDFCSAIKARELESSETLVCNSTSGTRSYTLTKDKKSIIVNCLNNKNINLNNINWIGERRTKLNSGAILQFGYGSFVNED